MAQTTTISLQDLDTEAQAPGSGASTPREEVGVLEANHPDRQHFSLPPVDTGKDAWLFLAACFFIEALVWGFPFAFGIFQEYYTSHDPFRGSSTIAVIGTCASGIMYLAGLPALMFNRMYPRIGRWSPTIGLLIMCIALALSSFSTTVTQLIVTQGTFYAIGGCIAYMPCILYMDEWFVKRKGLAYGIMWSGTGIAGVVLPLMLQHLLDAYGYKTTLRVWACALFALTAPLAHFIKPRLPPSPVAQLRAFNLGFALSRRFLLYQLANIVEAAGFFLPSIYLPSYAANALHAGSFPAALTVLLSNVSSVVGCVAVGFLIDHFHVTTCILASTAGTVAGTFLLWGFAASLPVLYVFCIVYGLFAGSFTTTWTGIMREMAAKNGAKAAAAAAAGGSSSNTSLTDARAADGYSNHIDPVMVFGLLAAGRGIGNVASGPLSEALMKGSPWRGQAGAGYGSGYGSLIIFTGVSALLGGSSFIARRIGWL